MKKIIIVTGASSGLGVCFARQLAEESAKFRSSGKEELASDEIYLIARRKDRLEETASQILKDAEESGFKNLFPAPVVCDLDITGKDGAHAFKKLLEEKAALEEDKKLIISILVNNAGFGTYGEFINTDTDRQMEMIDLDCTSLTGITGFALPYMTKGSRLINTASLASFAPLGNFAVYGACKAYVLSLSVALAAELKPRGIKVTALCPGSVSTEFANVASNGARKEVLHGLSAEKTVRHCVKASRKGKLYSQFAFKWRLKAGASKLLPRYLVAWYTFRFNKRPSK